MQNVHFTPPQLARLFQVNVSTIKRWVDRGLLESSRTPGGHRRVSQQQLAQFIKNYPKYDKKSYVLQRIVKKSNTRTPKWKQYYTALLNDETPTAERIVKELMITKGSIVTVLEAIITPTLQHIGNEWAEEHISIFQEHRMTFLIRQQLIQLEYLIAQKKPQDNMKLAILACPKGEHHEIILQMLDLVLKSHGWKTHILGINVPTEEVKKAIDVTTPQLVLLSKLYTNTIGKPYLDELAKYCKEENVDLLYGGTGWKNRKHVNAQYIASIPDFDNYLKLKK